MEKLNEGIFDDLINVKSQDTQNKIDNFSLPKKKKKRKSLIDDEHIVGEPSQKQLVKNIKPANKPEIVVKKSKPVIDVTKFDIDSDEKITTNFDTELQDYFSLIDEEEQQVNQQIKEQKEQQEKIQQEIEKIETAEKTLKKKARKKKIVDEIVQQKITQEQQKGNIVTNQQKEQLQEQLEEQVSIEQITPDDYAVVTEVLKDNNEQIADTNNTEVESAEFIEELSDAIENIPDFDSITDIDIKPIKKKTKEGYYKVKTSIKKDGIPKIINDIASAVKKLSNGIIKPRVCDLRVIGNTNKTQLRNSNLKLSVNCVVFKPNKDKLKVNKGTRIMLSIPDDYATTGNLLVYLQESRDKSIIEIQTKELGNTIEFFTKIIANYYYNGYEATLKRLQQKGVNNPLLDVIELVLSTRDYKIKTLADKETNRIYAVDFYTKGIDNDFMCMRLQEMDELGMYEILAFDTINLGFDVETGYRKLTVKLLEKEILNILSKFFKNDWKKLIIDENINSIKNSPNKFATFEDEDGNEITEEEYRKNIEKRFKKYNNLYRLEHNKLRKALHLIIDASKENPKFDIEIEKSFSKSNMRALAKEDYDAEMIQGKTKFVDFFLLSYLAYQIKAGDKRAGREYIDRQQYYQKYNVKNRNPYQLRNNTILTRQKEERNYNARIYLFQVQYKIKGSNKVNTYRCKSFADLIEATRFFIDKPIDNVKSPIE